MNTRAKAAANVDLQALFAPQGKSESLPAGHRKAESTDLVRFPRLCLAVRGWITPSAIFRDMAASRYEDVIAILAPEVETAATTLAGQWFLAVEARRQALAQCDETDLRRALQTHADSDLKDAFLQAFRLAESDAPIELAGLSADVLRALVNVHDWLGDGWHRSFGRDEINAAIAGKVLDADLERMTRLPLVGEAHQRALDKLRHFASPTTPLHGLRILYLHATGGGGKTTLLAFLQRALRDQLTGHCAIARIDFDEPGIDPSRMITFNLALFEQLAATVRPIRDRIELFLPQLRGAASALRMSDYAEDLPLAGWSAGRRRSSSLMAERQISESVTDQSSLLYGLLRPNTLLGPLVLVLDTAELVMEGDARSAIGVAEWLEFLSTETLASDIRLVIAGRDPVPAPGGDARGASGLFAQLARIGAIFEPPLALPELNPDESAALLGNCGVADSQLREAASLAVPGNPLLLKLTADALQDEDPKLVESIRSAHARSQVDRQSAQNYLMRRVIAHVADPAARPYVIAAMTSPILTSAMLGTAIMPRVDGNADTSKRARVRRVFQSIARTTWLGRLSPDGRRFTFDRDLRRLVMTLVEVVPETQALHASLHRVLRDYHGRRLEPLNRALRYFHAISLGESAILPSGRQTLAILSQLQSQFPKGRLQEELVDFDLSMINLREADTTGFAVHFDQAMSPGGQGSVLNAAARAGVVLAAAGPDRITGEDWRFYMEGRPGRPGQGDQLVRDDQARQALSMYRETPTREYGLPPTFVIQALADLGEWDADEVDVQAIVRSLGEHTPREVNANLDRLYWLTRYALQRDMGQLSSEHIGLLEKFGNDLKGPGLATMPPLLAVVEAFSGRTLLSPRMITGIRGNEGEGRIYLARRQRLDHTLAVGQFAVTQRGWHRAIRHTNAVPQADHLVSVQAQIDALHGQAVALVNRQFAQMRQPFQICWDGEDMQAGTLLLRGMTAEFLRPLREGLAACVTSYGTGRLQSVLDPTLAAMTIRPFEMEPAVLYDRLASNPRAWSSAFVGYADRSRLLPGLCEEIVRNLDHIGDAGERAARVARSFLAWDRALTGGIEPA